jgi:quinol monooxygenase YgiN
MPIVNRRTALLTTLACLCAMATVRAEPAGTLTFIDAQSDAVGKTKTFLQRYIRSLQKSSSTPSQIHALQEVERFQRFVVLTPATGPAFFSDPLNKLLVAPLDVRKHQDIPALVAIAAKRPSPKSNAIIFVVTHLDVGPSSLARGQTELVQLAKAARSSPGNLRFDVWQQTDRPNHFNVVAEWNTRAQFETFTNGAAARQFRATISPLMGALYDERLYRVID